MANIINIKGAAVTAKRAESVQDLGNDFLRCREKGHAWEHVTDTITQSIRNTPSVIVRHWECPRCTTGMEEVVDIPSFAILRRKYTYPDGYLLVSGYDENGVRINVRDIRRESLRRMGVVVKGASTTRRRA